jgi:ArsR family transcriptional regulator, arsenate/arsenite/antimonite-responsive transcriptional repressor
VKNRRCVSICEPGAPDPPDAGVADASLARLAWALAHPARVRIMRILLSRSACICGEIVEQLPLAQSTVSQHLKILKEAGLIQGEVDGPKTCYCVDQEALERFKRMVADL